MNKYIYSAAAFLSLSCIALTSCQNEMEQIGAPAGKEVLLRVTANHGDAETRTTLEHDGNGGLTCNWSKGDQLMVVGQSTGKKIGVVTLVSGEDTPNAVFEGNVDLSANSNVSLVYLGTTKNAETYSAELDNLPIDLSVQNGTFASLSDKDVLTSSTFVVDNSFSSKEVEIEDVTLTRQLAFGYFSLDFGGDVTLAAGDVITISGEGLRSEGIVNFKNGGSVPDNSASYTGSTSITITKSEAGNDFYVTMLPVGNVTPTFSVVKDGETYTAILGEHNWIAGEYVRAYSEQVDPSGVVVKMKKQSVDHTKNPLAKWADGNLYYSDGASSISESEMSLYQWGRNVGFGDYIDARGTKSKTSDGIQVYPYIVMNEDVEEAHPGTDVQIFYGGDYCTDAYYTLGNSNNDLDYLKKNHQGKFIMNGSFFNNTRDYWTFTSTEGGNNWYERATACGYKEANPCPSTSDGTWRLPTSEEFEQIIPKYKGTYDATISLEANLSDYAEIRALDLDQKYKYAIKWTVTNSGLTITALMVPNSYTIGAIKASSMDWSDSNVVVKYFPFTGAIKADTRTAEFKKQVVQNGPYYTSTINGYTDFLASPTPLFNVSTKSKVVSIDRGDIYSRKWFASAMVYVFPNIDDALSCVGVYWTSDKKAMSFMDNSQYSGAPSGIDCGTVALHNAYAIRPVLDK